MDRPSCECGCGLQTPIAKSTRERYGQVAGRPLRFIHGHNARRQSVKPHIYRSVLLDGTLQKVHRLRAEKALGKPLPTKAVVHLAICEDKNYHNFVHVRMRIKAAGGDPNTDAICGACRRVKPQSEFWKNRGRRLGLDTRCKDCLRSYQADRRARMTEIESMVF